MNSYSSEETGKDILRLHLEPHDGGGFLTELWCYSEVATGGGGGPILYRESPFPLPIVDTPLPVVKKSPSSPDAECAVYTNFSIPRDKFPASESFEVPISYRWHAPSRANSIVVGNGGAFRVIATSSGLHTWGAHIRWEEL